MNPVKSLKELLNKLFDRLCFIRPKFTFKMSVLLNVLLIPDELFPAHYIKGKLLMHSNGFSDSHYN